MHARRLSRDHTVDDAVALHATESSPYTDGAPAEAAGTREVSRLQGSQFNRALELGDYVAFIKRRWRWVALGLVLGLLAGAAYLQLAPKTYTSTAKVLVYATTSDTEAENGVTNSGVNLDTEAQIVQSVDVAEVAAEALGEDSDPVDLASHVTVTVPANTTVLEIAFDGSSPERAQAGASAFADAYLDNRASVARDAIDSDVDSLRARMDDLTSELSKVTREFAESDSSNERAVLRARRSQLTSELDTLNTTIGPLEGSVQSPGRVIVGAQTPEAATSPRPYLVMVSAALLGFLGALALAILREKFDRRPHTVNDLGRLYGLPTLAEVRVRNTVTGFTEAPVAEVRALYHAMIASYAGSTRTVLVCGPYDQSSAHAVGVTLAALAAQTGTTTTLVGRAGVDQAPLSSEHRDIDRRGLLSRKNFASLGLIKSGELRHRQIRPVLDGLESEYDLCVLELPTGDSAFDLPLVGRHVDLVLITIDLDETSRTEMEAIVDDIQKVGATEVAAVAVRRPRKRRGLGRGKRAPRSSESSERSLVGESAVDADDVVDQPDAFEYSVQGEDEPTNVSAAGFADESVEDLDVDEAADPLMPSGASGEATNVDASSKRPWFARRGV